MTEPLEHRPHQLAAVDETPVERQACSRHLVFATLQGAVMGRTTVTRVAHSCVLLDFDGQRILTDPWFGEKPGYRQGEVRALASAADLPELAGVPVSP